MRHITRTPDLAVEVLSPTNYADEMRIKVVNYLLAGTTVWVVDPINKRVEVYIPNQSPFIVGIDGELDGGTVLPVSSCLCATSSPISNPIS